MEFRLYMLQRLSALILAPLVLCHLVLIIYAFRGGLTATEILSRTQGSLAWAIFYGLFVLAVAVHASIGLRVIANELLKLEGWVLNILSLLVFFGLFYLGARAVYAVTAL